MATILDCELTDTFGGQPNYSWVSRAEVSLPPGATDRAIVRAGKAALGLTGCRCRTYNHGDQWELRPSGSLTVAFLTVRY
jgi:hypothetical protein